LPELVFVFAEKGKNHMVTSELKDNIVWLYFEGALNAEEAMAEISQWLPIKDTFDGFISDIRKMTDQPAADQKKLEEWRKANGSEKPNAILAKDNIMAVLARVYIRFTRAESTRYFTDAETAKAWIREFASRQA
jgi:hypothetical protein